MTKSQEVQYGKHPATTATPVVFGKHPATAGRIETTPQNTPQNTPSVAPGNTGVVPGYAGGDPPPATAAVDAAVSPSED